MGRGGVPPSPSGEASKRNFFLKRNKNTALSFRRIFFGACKEKRIKNGGEGLAL